MNRVIILSFLMLSSVVFSLYGEIKYILQPPKGWDCINDPEQLPKKIKEIYVGKTIANNRFTPSLNIAQEETGLPISQYVQVAKSYHEGQAGTRCMLLGKFMTSSGPAELLQIDRTTQWGPVRFVQAMLIQDGEAYVITATCLKNEYSILSTSVFKAIQSFTIPSKILHTK